MTINDALNPSNATPNPNIVSAQDYYPFGMQMPGRSYIAGGSLNYRYGFNGKENDNEVEGVGNQIDYGMRVYDPRVGRFLSTDPFANTFPWNSTYAFAENDVIRSIDLDGLERVSVTTSSFAPYAHFGSDLMGYYSGDGENRIFGDGGSYRISGTTILDLGTYKLIQSIAGNTYSTYHRLLSPFPDYRVQSPSKVSVDAFKGDSKSSMAILDFSVAGTNHAALFSCDIDDKVHILFQKEKENQFLVSGIVSGDRFPANETYLKDEAGNNLILGVSGPDKIPLIGANKDIGPYALLPGKHDKLMSDLEIHLSFAKDSKNRFIFNKITLDGVTFSLQDWNGQFSKKDPKDPRTQSSEKPYVPSKTYDTGNSGSKSDYSY